MEQVTWQINKTGFKNNSQLVSPLSWRKIFNTQSLYEIHSKWNQEILFDGILTFPIKCNCLMIYLPIFYHRMEGYGGLVLVSARVFRVIFLLLTKVLTVILQKNGLSCHISLLTLLSTISISVPVSQRQLPPSPANTSLDHRSHSPQGMQLLTQLN